MRYNPSKPFHLHFAILGDYDDIDLDFENMTDAVEKLESMKKSLLPPYEYFASISLIMFAEREPPLKKEEQ